MDVNDFMAKHGLTDADLERMAAPYEDGSIEPEPDGKGLLSDTLLLVFVSLPAIAILAECLQIANYGLPPA